MNKEKIKSLIFRIKQNGIKPTLRKAKNYILYKKTVPNEYKEWKINNEPNKKNIDYQKKYKSCQNIKFTIIIPNKNEIQEKSIENQTYKNFEILYSDEQNYEQLLENATGDYIIFMDETKILLPFALYEIVQAITNNYTIFLYSDSDEINKEKRENPDFKLGFGIDTILSKNFIGNFFIIQKKFLKYNKDILKQLDKEIYYDIILRIIEKTDKIYHIQKILYSELNLNKMIDTINEKKCIQKYLERNNIGYKTIEDGKYIGQYHITYNIYENEKISIIIPNKDQIEDLKKCIESIEKLSTYTNYEIVIVENNSEDTKTFDYYKKIENKYKNIKIVKFPITYFNYSSIINFGVKNSDGKYIILLNNDIEIITENWMEEMLMYAQRKDVGICGAKLYFPDRSIQHAGVTIGIRGLAGHRYHKLKEEEFTQKDSINFVQNINAVTAACFIVEKELYNKLLGFDEKLAVAFNDIDFCLKVRKENKLIVYNPFVEMYHYESKSRGQDTISKEKQDRFAKEYEIFVRRWAKTIESGDQYFNTNYRLDTDIPTINYNKIKQ